MTNNIIVILAGGLGTRYNASVPKQYTLIKGKPVVELTLEQVRGASLVDKIIVVVDDMSKGCYIQAKYEVDVILGGDDRAHSFQNALEYIIDRYSECDKVIFHEAARPLVKSEVFDRYFELLNTYDYVMTCSHITDSLGSYSVRAPKREEYFLIQAPEAYNISILKKYYNCESDVYFAANQFPKSCKGYKYFDVKNNIKLTTPEDKALIEFFLR